MFWSSGVCQNIKRSWKLGGDWKRASFAEYFSSGRLNVWVKDEKGAFYSGHQFDSNITDQYTYSSQIHSFSIYSHKKAINVYMLTCSEAVPQRCSHEADAPKNARQTHGRIPTQEYDFNGTASQLH